ncbi:MAG TPA: glycoside hydrolase family 3 N-terminal domain-containing protein, partial [Puia sp.]|nr:glycoside hydrolase family 3 N-terminal domain-containing protein [Puia sp.]
MKRLSLCLVAICCLAISLAQTPEQIKQQVDALIKQMTLDEKVGQMTQVTMALVAKGGWGNQDGSLDPAALKKAIQEYKVGSILNTTAHALSVDTWRQVQTQIQDEAKNSRLKIPVIYGLDGIHGQT